MLYTHRRLLGPLLCPLPCALLAAALLGACSPRDPGNIRGIPYDSNNDGIEDSVGRLCPGADIAIHPDSDGDGLGNPAVTLRACGVFARWVTNADDCDDSDAEVGAATTWYGDADGDGLGDPAVEAVACEPPPGFVRDAGDAYPGCRDDLLDECGVCNGPGGALWYADVDGDGRSDGRIAVRACAAPEGFVDEAGDDEPECPTDDTDDCGVCGGRGAAKDCAGTCFGTAVVDDCGVCGGEGGSWWWADADGDGLGDRDRPSFACDAPAGAVANDDDPEPDCPTNDTDPCGACAGSGPATWYADVDGDGLGDARAAVAACAAPDGFVATAGDPQPECATDDTDGCGVCGGAERDRDCGGVCFGTAALDGCGRCAGGTTGRLPATVDDDGDGIPDLCDLCDTVAVRRTIIQWDAVLPFAGEHGPYTFQLVLYDDGEFRFQYRDLGLWGATATVGYQSADRTRAVTLANGSAFPTDHRVVHFRRLPGDGSVAVEYTVPMAWVDIAATGTELAMDDDALEPVDIGFPFPFFGTTYSRVTVAANGFVAFAEPFASFDNAAFPVASAGPMIAPLWDDLNPARGGRVFVQTLPAGCEFDCAGMRGGAAVLDRCGDCFGGTTGVLREAAVDCTGVCDGGASYDVCGGCTGGSTGIPPASEDDCEFAPDLVVDRSYLASTMYIERMVVEPGDCLIGEGCVRGSGERKLLRFGTRIANVGNADLRLGTPPRSGVSSELWHWDACHGHHHFEEYAAYDIFDVASGTMVPIGTKTGFCVMDIGVYDARITRRCNGYDCTDQGITAGCQDTYSNTLQCQWIDITGLADGVYDVIVTTNPEGLLDELDLTNNSASVRVRITGDTVEYAGP